MAGVFLFLWRLFVEIGKANFTIARKAPAIELRRASLAVRTAVSEFPEARCFLCNPAFRHDRAANQCSLGVRQGMTFNESDAH